MRLRAVKPGDVVVCELRGARFTARVQCRDERGLAIDVVDRRELPRGLFPSHVTARQVVRRVREARA